MLRTCSSLAQRAVGVRTRPGRFVAGSAMLARRLRRRSRPKPPLAGGARDVGWYCGEPYGTPGSGDPSRFALRPEREVSRPSGSGGGAVEGRCFAPGRLPQEDQVWPNLGPERARPGQNAIDPPCPGGEAQARRPGRDSGAPQRVHREGAAAEEGEEGPLKRAASREGATVIRRLLYLKPVVARYSAQTRLRPRSMQGLHCAHAMLI